MKTPSPAQCPHCGAPLAGGLLNGLCPDCLALVAFGSDPGEETTVVPGRSSGPSQPQPLLTATVRYFGDYELLEEIGRGGMGVVYRARQVSLNRIVAVKMILAGQFAGPSERQRFQREAEAAAHLRHPNIVAIHEVGEHEGRSYFSMDYIEGRTLSAVLREGKLPAGKAATLLKTVAEAVHYAHQRGTLHRDLKPQNILISADGQPHILDFGLARPIEGAAELTRTGEVMGSPSYMPPEQASGRMGELGPASDVYALGAILYEAVTGRPPFTGQTVALVLRQVIETDPVRPRRWNPNVPADLETICLKCLEKRPERRYPSARALVEELDRFLNFEPILGRPAGRLRKIWSWSQQNPWALAAGCGLLVLVLAGVADAFWEKSRFLAWQLQAGKDAQLTRKESPSLLFLKLFPVLCSLLYFAGNSFRRLYRRRVETGASLLGWRLFVHAGLGALGTAAGMGYLRLQIRSWVWSTSPTYILAFEWAGAVCALVLNWMGLRMVWEAVGMHETSRFGGVVDKSLERQLAGEARQWSVFKLVGFALWLWLVAWALSLVFFSLILSARGLDLVLCLAGLALSVAVSALLAWVVRKRLRLFTFVFVPLALALFAFALGVVIAENPKVVAGLFGFSILSAILTLSGLNFFQGGSSALSDQRRRFPGNPWLDALGGLAFFIALVFLFHAVENWRGRREWSRAQAELAAKGESAEFLSFVKPPVPDAENVMAHPYMKQHFLQGGRTLPISGPTSNRRLQSTPFSVADLQALPRRAPVLGEEAEATSLEGILKWYDQYGGEFAQLEEALARPRSRLRGDPRNLMAMPIPNAVSFRVAAQAYVNLAKVHLVMGDAEAALRNVRLLRQLIDAAQANEPAPLVSAMLRVSLVALHAEMLQEMLAAALWPAPLLEQVQRLCDGPDALTSVGLSLRGGERAGMIQWLRSLVEEENKGGFFGLPRPMAALFPDGWFYQNYATIARFFQLYLDGVDLAGQRLDARRIEAGDKQLSVELGESRFRPFNQMAALMIPNVVGALQKTAKTQALLDEAFMACALERYHATAGSYPETLDALVPKFAAKVPRDWLDGQPLRYRRRAGTDGGYLLYAVGWNSTDDQGRMPLNPQGQAEWQNQEGDWVWQGVPKR